ncbi:MAG: hypothetical protein JO221_10150 [Sphingomonas sp.]|uniref:Uncharacterized protein n=1 Tax=Sphingomonas lycopersici TaxID=2951807 RepID=A0AA41ZAM1_9SPHN|nr:MULTISPECIES: hypothetical protein [Sphingomonas]MBV8239121.1 hypothetical protein [Sphingomonas sp.]MCW6532792.1 hypothetical protein [Sphingomonas lycopersici]MCW6536530.1 hypothetical protein [Sphingomonas lycopersici]OJU14485.1 MAG: hypothetical protein BGN95_00100 [Sphingomonas sp. 66-10]
MDLSFAGFDIKADAAVPLPVDLAVLLVRIAARQAASPTAIAQAQMMHQPSLGARFAPADGAFNGIAARTLTEWRDR